MSNSRPSPPEHKIKSFLKEHRDADVIVCTGNASVKGLAWLARQVDRHRKVTLVIGDMTANNFTKATEADRSTAATFLRGSNVTVHNWYRTRPVKKIAHGKAIVAQRNGRTVATLVGSANLTETGLSNNLEMMVRCHPDDWSDIEAYIDEATRHPAANAKLIGYVAPDKDRRNTTREPAASGSGCLTALAMLPLRATVDLWRRLATANLGQWPPKNLQGSQLRPKLLHWGQASEGHFSSPDPSKSLTLRASATTTRHRSHATQAPLSLDPSVR